jgi:ribosomal protein S11
MIVKKNNNRFKNYNNKFTKFINFNTNNKFNNNKFNKFNNNNNKFNKYYDKYKNKRIIIIKKRPITDINVNITETLNNLFMTIYKINGLVIGKSSSGHMKLQKKKIPLVAEILGNYIGKKILEKGFKSYTLIVTGLISKLVKSAIRGLKKNYIICKSIKMKHNLTHNGVRLPIAKRK